MKIYTKGGDKGKTGLRGGVRVDKDDIRIEVNGTLDELNSTLGVVRSYLDQAHPWQTVLFTVQKNMIRMMSRIATPPHLQHTNPNTVEENFLESLEEQIDRITRLTGECSHFILPGGTHVSAFLHLSRTVARRSERRLCTLQKTEEVDPQFMKIINRLSDLLFVMARYEMIDKRYSEEKMHAFSTRKYKEKQQDKM